MIDNSGPAFPVIENTENGYPYTPEGGAGLTKREWFAGQALTGLLATRHGESSNFVRDAVKLADALIAELAKEKP